MARILFSLVFALLLGAAARGQSSSAMINRALDGQVRLDLDASLPEALQAIARETGVRLEAVPEVWDLLPWGEQTHLTAKIENQTLRDALEAICRTMGLQFALREEAIELRPLPALTRLGRRATLQELEAVRLLATTPLDPGAERPTVRQLIDMVDLRLVAIDAPFAVESRPGDSVSADQLIALPRGASLLDALEAIARDTRATWYPWGQSIVIVPKNDQVQSMLARTITIRYDGVTVAQVLAELSQRAGVPFTIEPGAVQRIPPEFRSIRLDLYNATIRQTLENLAGFTGLSYSVNDNGVFIYNARQEEPSGAARDPMLAIIRLSDDTQLLLPSSQAPPDVREYLDRRRQEAIEAIRGEMRSRGFVPSGPTTQPSPDL